MFKNFFSADPFKTFYFVFAYILAFALWWAYLLYAKNETAYKEKIELNQISFQRLFQNQKGNADYTITPEFHQLHSKYLRQKFMIVGEGGVFILLLLFGLMRVRKVFSREMELADQQRNFLLSITHELKSPLSTVKLSLQTMAKHKLDAEKANKLITNSLVDLDRLESLVDNILFAAKIERDEPGFSDEEINVSEIVQMSVERFANNKKAIVILQNIKPDVYLNADAIGFTSVITNLVENAVKYSGEETTVVIDLKEDEQAVFLTVSDNGIGIADAEKKKVFEKFYRVGNENTRNTRGTGLGLYIVHRFVEIYKGGISIADNSPGGSIFKLTLSKRQFAEQN